MCGRYRLNRDEGQISEHFEIEGWSEIQIPFRLPRFNVAPTQDAPAVRLDIRGRRELVGLRWGLVPSWANGPKTGYRMVNARAETAAEKPVFRDAFRQRRCLIPSDGFYEWQTVGRRKQPWLVRLQSAEALLRPYPSELLSAYPVSMHVNSPKNDDELCGARAQ